VKPAILRAMISERMDPVLFGYSYNFVGDLAETISLVWPTGNSGAGDGVPLAEVAHQLSRVSRSDAPTVVAALLDQSTASERFAIIKLVTGELRIGVSARLAKQALADLGQIDINEIEELWHGLHAPYADLFAWLEGKADKPVPQAQALFRPVMLSNPMTENDYPKLDPSDYCAEWKWDGIRVQVVAMGGAQRLYSRTGDDISGSFPDLMEAIDFEGVIDGELLVGDPQGRTATFSDLQQRLNRKSVSAKVQTQYPVFVRCYDILQAGEDDLRALIFTERRKHLEAFVANLDPTRFDVSRFVPFSSWEELDDKRKRPPHPIIEGVMAKRWDSTYVPGRPKGPWFKWKRDPFTVDAVLMYAQRGSGRRASFYSDYTFGVWSGPEDAPELVPVGKAYFGFTDAELKLIDKFVRDNTIERFGPVRSVRANIETGLVFEVAFEGLNRSTRHKSGVAMRFPRINRLRWDKPTAEADRIETLQAMLDG
jgi:DNA ligase-1